MKTGGGCWRGNGGLGFGSGGSARLSLEREGGGCEELSLPGGGCEAARGVVVGLVGAGWLPPLELLALGSSFLPSLHFCTLFPEALSFGPHLFWTGHEIYKSRFFV